MTGEKPSGMPGLPPGVERFAELAYRLRRPARGLRPGAHRGRLPGAQGLFDTHAPLHEMPDPRRIDIRASIRDPFGMLLVRRFRIPTETDVHIMVDMSASMGAIGRVDRRQVAINLAAGLALMVQRSGDRVSLTAGANGAPIQLPLSRRRSIASEVLATLEATPCAGQGIDALLDGAATLPTRPGIVFLLSDFAMPPEPVERLLGALNRHDVRPVVLADSLLDAPPPRFGLTDMVDMETGRRRTVLMRPGLARAWHEKARDHAAGLNRIFSTFAVTPILIQNQIDIDRLMEQLAMTGVAA